MHEAYDYFARIYNETTRGGLGVQVLPAKVPVSNALIDERHPLNQDDLVLAVHPTGQVSIEREPPDDNSRYPIQDLPPYAYHQAVENFARNDETNREPVVPTTSNVIIIDDNESDEGSTGTDYDYPGDLSQLSEESYDEIEALDRALALSMAQQ